VGIVLIAIAAIAFACLSRRAEAGARGSFHLAWLEAFALSCVGAFTALFAFVMSSLQCDESCTNDRGWAHTSGAPEWGGQLFLAEVGFVCVVAALVLTHRRRHGWAIAAMGFAAVSFGIWAALMDAVVDGLGF
jgi:hypothetical protein